MIDVIEAMDDPNLFAPWFKNQDSWQAWRVVLKALFALTMNDQELALFNKLTGRTRQSTQPVKESWWVVGRRGGKSFIVALVAVYLACFFDYRRYLSPGERGVVMVLAADRRQARVIMRYVTALLEGVPMLAKLIVQTSKEAIELSNYINIEIHTTSFRSTRGYTVVAALCDEIAFWRSEESANPDIEIINALRPAMATIPNSMLIGIGSPYRRNGVLYESCRDYYGKDDDGVLVVQAPTQVMNPSIPEKVIADAYAKDPTAASAEYGAEFRSDISGFLTDDWIDKAVQWDQHELPYNTNYQYQAFVDPSGGGKDAFTLAISHNENHTAILDVCRGRRPPFDPSNVVAEFAKICKQYGCHGVQGDRYAGQWPVEAFNKEGVSYVHSQLTKSEIYLEVEPRFATGAIRLLDHRQLLTELRQLERRTMRSGKDQVDHPPRGHDDYANAAAGALGLAGVHLAYFEPEVVGRSLAADTPMLTE